MTGTPAAAATPEQEIKTKPVPPEGTPYRDLYIEAGETCPTISGKLLAAQGKQESVSWTRKYVYGPSTSPAGAMGVAQMMPGTWPQWGGNGNPWDPADAIPAQARLMCALSERYNGDLDLILSGYNAGTGAVDKYKGVPQYRETLDYIAKIRATYASWPS